MPKITEGRVFVGAAGRATELIFTTEPTDRPDVSGTVAMWFLDCPGQSPAWRNYHLAAIHLRPIPGVKAAVITRPGATHEIILVALDPQLGPKPDDVETWRFLRPLNLVGQLKLPSDDSAIRALEVLAKAVAHGQLWAEPPLSGQTEPWQSQLRHLEDHARGLHEEGAKDE